MGHKGPEDGDVPHVIALLPPDAEDATVIREALARLDPASAFVADLDALVESVRSGQADLLVCDARAADPREAHARARAAEPDDRPAAVFLAVVDGTAVYGDALDEDPGLAHYLSRPFRVETLTALCRALTEEPRAGRAVEGRVHVRRPARFSARPLYSDAVAYARDSFEAAREGHAPDMRRVLVMAERIHTSLLQSNLLLNRALEPYKRFDIATHSVNVAIFAAKIALSRELPLGDTLRVIQAGLLHDVGMARLPEAILAKEGTLTDEERAEMQRHPVLGAEIAERLGPDHAWLVPVLGQEHERAGGQGYPEGLEGDTIDPLARILGVADVFEAFSHARAYRSPFTAYEALERVVAMRNEYFDGEIVDALADEISVFPLDSYVQLSTGAIGRVIATNPENLMRPTIEVLWNRSWAPVEPTVVALDTSPDLSIERPLHESEVPIT